MFKKMIIASSLVACLTWATHVSAAEYTVQTNDTLWKVSQKFKVTVAQLKEWNHLTTNTIRPKQVLVVSNVKSVTTTKVIQHKVQPKEYLNGIAKQYGTTVSEILKLNPSIKNASLIKVGQVLSIPSKSTTTTTQTTSNTTKPVVTTTPTAVQNKTKGISIHTIQPGEFLSSVAKKYGMNLNLLLAFNENITNANVVKVGQKVNIPNEDLIILSKIIYAEARGESLNGKIAVGNVVMNRVDSKSFPNTVKDVVYQPNQFAPVKTGKIDTVTPTKVEANAAIEAYNNNNLVKDALYFYAPTTTSTFLKGLHTVSIIGGHVFAK